MSNRGMLWVVAALAAVLASSALAAPAGAARTEVATMPSGAPHLVDGGAVFLSAAPGRTRVMRAAPGRAPVEIGSFPNPPSADEWCCGQSYDLRLAADAGYAAASRHLTFYLDGRPEKDSFEIAAGPVSGSLSKLAECSGNHPLDVDGTRIAYLGGCDGPNEASVIVRDLAAPGAPVVATVLTGRVDQIDLAGQHLASYIDGGTIRVRELGSDRDAYVVTKMGRGMALQADGKLAVMEPEHENGGPCWIDWYSKAEPVPHAIPGACSAGPISFAGDRVAIGRKQNGSGVDVLTLAGARQTLASFSGRLPVSGVDFDGSRVAYNVRACSARRDAVYIDDLSGPPAPPARSDCPATISPAAVRASSSGMVRVGFNCPEGCYGFLTLRRGGKPAVRRVDLLDEDPGAGRATMRLTSSMRSLLRRRGSLVVQARLQADQRGGAPRTVKRAIRLLAPK